MRILCLALALLITPALATAQHARQGRGGSGQGRGEHARPAERPPHAQQLPAAPPPTSPSSIGSIGLPLGSIGLPLSPIGLQPVPTKAQPVPGANRLPDHPAYAPGRGNHLRRPGLVYVSPYYYGSGIGYPIAPEPPASAESGYPQEEQAGRLRLDIQPLAQAQLFVDGEFVGMLEDIGGEIDLRPGPRRIEIRVPGYHPLVFDARIEVQRIVTYRGALEPLEREPRTEPAPRREPSNAPPPPVATGSRTMYVIPGCYLGNVMPQKEKLREGCDLGSMKTITP